VVVTTLATAWLVISILSRIIRNRFIANLVAVSAWTIAALNVFGILDDTISVLDSLSVVLGEVRVSALLVINSLVICSLLIWGALGISGLLERQLTQIEDLTPSARVLVSKIFRIFILLVAFLTGLNVVGIDLTALAVFSGALGLGIGFGLQKIVSNLLSGIILLLDKSIKPGDVIEIQTPTGSTYGWVEHLGARYTSVRTRDGIDTLFPNETFIASPVTNWSHGDTKVRQKLSVGVSYDADVEKAIALCLEAAHELDRVLKDPAPRCLLVGFGDSSIDLQLRYWLVDPQEGLRNIASEAYLSIWKKFREHQIEIPYPQRDLHIRSAERLPVGVEQLSAETAGG
jgi:small-conductance mechanosensitive channel